MYIVAGMARDCDQTLFCMVFVLAMTAARPHLAPTIAFDYLYEIADFHGNPGLTNSGVGSRIVSEIDSLFYGEYD
jgi:hypothetical protein